MHFFELGALVREARTDKGMTQARVAELAELSRVTVNQLENGAAPDLGIRKLAKVLTAVGLSLMATPPPSKRDFLRMACTSANVSFRRQLTPDDLAHVFLTGRVAPEFRPHLRVVLEEIPTNVLHGAIRQVARIRKVEEIRQNVLALASKLGATTRFA